MNRIFFVGIKITEDIYHCSIPGPTAYLVTSEIEGTYGFSKVSNVWKWREYLKKINEIRKERKENILLVNFNIFEGIYDDLIEEMEGDVLKVKEIRNIKEFITLIDYD